jgi:hypothetical protein
MKRRRYTHTEAFLYFGVTPRNTYWSWSGRSPDGETVVVTLWDHDLGMVQGRYSYEDRIDVSKLGGRFLREDLEWALDRCNGRVHVIRAFANDPRAEKIKIEDCEPASFTMKVARLDLESGEYVLQIELPEQLAA